MAALLLAASCVPRATVPIRAVSLEERPSKSLVVLLPGRFDEAEDFSRRRFPEIAREAGGTFDIVAKEEGQVVEGKRSRSGVHPLGVTVVHE